MINIKEAKKSFKNSVIFEHLNLVIHHPGLYVIQGESGSGKSTLLNILAGFDFFDSGEISVNSNISTIFQNYELIQEINVKENILLTKKEFSEEELQLLEKLGIKELLNYYPNECSGGQQQRIGIARSLLLNPNIILCDEPTESLDIANKHIVMKLLKEISKEKIVVMATHDQNMINEYADCCFKIENKMLVQKNEYQNQNKVLECLKQLAATREINHFIHKILYKKTMLASLFLVFLLILVQGLFIFEKKMFYISDTQNVVNADRLYIDAGQGNDFEFKKISIDKSSITHIPKFRSVEVDNQLINCHIYPYVENNLKIEGKKARGNSIVINQNVAKKIGEPIGKKVMMNYFMASLSERMEFTIGGIIDEEDSNELSIYYDLDYVKKELSSRQLSIGSSQLDYMNKYGTYFEAPTHYELLHTHYEKAKKTTDVFLMNTLYDEREEFKESMIVYQLLFYTFEVLILIGIYIFMTIYVVRDTNHYLSICSILVSMQMPLDGIRKSYLKTKIEYFVSFLILGELGIYFIFEFLGIKQLVNIKDIYLILVCLMLFVVWYLILLYTGIQKLQKSKISIILKNGKD